ncbi:hypothetical protein FACS1894167_10050 [Synergistales bacterium]|nr:hypothetical protein FACS1894167_10050 [Synergistales bacterium]GHV50961.1 hypothetical protein FACS1894216_04080 [Synergistales bacterium]
MQINTCRVCGKIFGASDTSVCPSCRKLLDIVYEKARSYLRDNPKAELDSKSLAKAIEEDVKLIEILVAEGRFDPGHEMPTEEANMDKRRKKLLDDIQKNLSARPVKEEQERTTYGSDRHGERRNKD